VTGGYYAHVGKHFYIYPTAAYTYNNVYSGETSVNGTTYKTDKVFAQRVLARGLGMVGFPSRSGAERETGSMAGVSQHNQEGDH
jgi:hypothetical protein